MKKHFRSKTGNLGCFAEKRGAELAKEKTVGAGGIL
jgi:hypothetical protein